MKNKIFITIACFALASSISFAQVPNLPGSGNCLSYNGTSDYVEVANESNFDFERTSPFTLEAWFNTSIPSGPGSISSIIGKGGSSGFWFYIIYGNVSMVLTNVWPSNCIYIRTNATYSDGMWHHASVTYNGNSDASGVIIYVDGVQVSLSINENSLTGSILNNNALRIGDRVDSSPDNFPGSIDEVRIWNIARTQTEIRNTMCQKLVGNEPGLVGYWRFDESSGTTAYDSQTNFAPNNGTLKP